MAQTKREEKNQHFTKFSLRKVALSKVLYAYAVTNALREEYEGY